VIADQVGIYAWFIFSITTAFYQHLSRIEKQSGSLCTKSEPLYHLLEIGE
jgi:hypothetical protein